MKTIAWSGYLKTKKGRRVYDRKKHAFTWQRASRICYVLINDDIDIDKRERYYVRMRAGLLGYSYAMLRMYPGFAKSYLLGLASGGAEKNRNDAFAKQWRDTTFAIIDRGLDAITTYSGLPDGYAAGAKFLAMEIGQKYWDFLDSLIR